MATFYNTGQQGPGNTGGGGFYNNGGGAGAYGQQFQQGQQSQQGQHGQQQGQPQPPSFANFQQWQPNNNNNTQQGTTNAQPSFLNPTMTAALAGAAAQAAAGGFSNEAVIDWAIKGGKDVIQTSGASFVPGFDATMQTLRTYFAVDNRYVKRKMLKVLFPFRSKQWKRMQLDGPNLVNYALPHSDENAPDLYLPLMSLISYCLLCALGQGTAGEFDPEAIADVTTKCFLTQILEVALIKLGFYMMQAPISVLDLFSYTGYKYLGLACNMLFGLGFGHLGYGTTGFYVTFLWTVSAACFFMLKTMANNIPTETASAGPKREMMVLVFAASQVLTMWFVSQTKYL